MSTRTGSTITPRSVATTKSKATTKSTTSTASNRSNQSARSTASTASTPTLSAEYVRLKMKEMELASKQAIAEANIRAREAARPQKLTLVELEKQKMELEAFKVKEAEKAAKKEEEKANRERWEALEHQNWLDEHE